MNNRRYRTQSLAALLPATLFVTALLGSSSLAAQTEPTPRERAESVHQLMHHGLAMATEAADLVMISQLGMAPNLDAQGVDHGREGLVQGRELIESAADIGSALEGQVSVTMLNFTTHLREAYLDYVEIVEGMPVPDPDSEQMAVHHMHMMINHTVRIAADSANLTMIGTRDRDADVAELGALHGRAMLDNARLRLEQLMVGPSMQRAHQADLTDSPMQTAHQMVESARRIFDLMDAMPVSTE